MSDDTSNPHQNIPLSPPLSDHGSISEHGNNSFGSQHHSDNPGEDTVAPALALASSEEEANLGEPVLKYDVPVKPVSEPRLPLNQSIGKAGLATIFGGMVLILALVAFLAFLWFGAGTSFEGKSAPWVWRRIALHGWVPQVTTLIALVLRTIVAAQAVACTSSKRLSPFSFFLESHEYRQFK